MSLAFYKTDVLIIGAGASGLAAAAAAADKGAEVCVLERNIQPAKKIYATGNGRCNYTNTNAAHSKEVLEFMKDEVGIEPAEENGRIYPSSFEASSVAEALVSAAERRGAEIITDARAVAVQKNAQRFVVKCEDGREFSAAKLILATGGKAGIQYGCTGDGYKLAESLGHSVVKPVPALDGLCCKESTEDIHGVRIRGDVALKGSADGIRYETISKSSGEVQFTKNGISGICVMDLSRNIRYENYAKFRLELDLFPGQAEPHLASLLEERERLFKKALSWLIPEKLKDHIVKRLNGSTDPKVIASFVKALPFEITGTRGWKTAQVTSGGVPLGEVHEDSFESKLAPGLYITGELLDFDGPCGGYNLDHAIFSGFTAGRSVLEK